MSTLAHAPWISLVVHVRTSKDAINSKVEKMLEILLRSGMAWYSEEAPAVFAVHPKNRGGLMLGPNDSQVKGAKMLSIGVKLDKLTDAVAMEMSSDPAMRQQQVSKNQALINVAGGLLAPMNGKERYLTLGMSHITAFCKAVMAGAKTQQFALSSEGTLNLTAILQKHGGDTAENPFAIMCNKGWRWLIISKDVELACPWLPALIQSGLNSSHAVGLAAQEIEVAATMAMHYEQNDPKDWQAAVEAASAVSPPRLSYIEHVAKFVRDFGGGEGSPLIMFLDEYSKALGCSSVTIGQELLRCA